MIATPEGFVTGFADAWAARDATALAALFAPDADFVNVVGLWWHDRAAIEKAHAYGLKHIFPASHLRAGRINVRQLGTDHAVLHVRWHLSGQTAPDGTQSGDRTSVMSVVLERQGNGWLAVSAQNTDVVPGAETMINRDGALAPQDYRAP